MTVGNGSPRTITVVGAGLAGAKAVEALRDGGFDGTLTLVGGEDHRPYERPPLSKDYLTGKAERESVFTHPPTWYADHDVELLLGEEAVAIDRDAGRVRLRRGGDVAYDRLLLATGSRPRALPDSPAGVYYLRTLDDSDRLRAVLGTPSARLVVIGAGWIGMEVAAAARQAGLAVTVLESQELPLLHALGPEVARVFADLHAAHGVDLRFGAQVAAVDAHRVRLADGTVLEADAVLAGIGATPNTEPAEQAGLTLSGGGVQVDASLRTSDPDIFAAGDIANAYHPLFGRHIRVEHWSAALNQPAVAAAGMLGETAEYDRLPYFFTDQYDTHWVADPEQGKRAVSPGLSMEYRGYVGPEGYDRVVFRGDVGTYEFVAFWLKDGRMLAGMNVNVWDVAGPIEALIRSRKVVPSELLADTGVPLGEIAT